MPDLEKVLKGLECCRKGFCFACPYNDGVDDNVDCKQKWADDALELLKAQEPVKPEKRCSTGGVTWWYVCGNCDVSINPNAKYCHQCGRKVAWE